jgi:hypothetical protein
MIFRVYNIREGGFMSRTKLTAIGAVVIVFCATIAVAASAHFINCSKSSQGTSVTVSFKIAGLGNETTCVTVSADARAEFACFNNGGKNPSAENKRTVNAQVVKSDCFTPHNGSISGSLTINAPGPGDFSCPPGQKLRLLSVTYSNVKVTDTTHNVTCTP